MSIGVQIRAVCRFRSQNEMPAVAVQHGRIEGAGDTRYRCNTTSLGVLT